MAFNTGNPIGSTDARDLSDNAQNFDEAINDRSNQTWTDRLGVGRKTVWGAFAEITYKAPVAYATGISFLTTDANKTVEEAGVVYAPLNSALPFTTSGTFAGDDDGRFYPVQDKNNVIRVTSIADIESYSAPAGYVFSLNAGGLSGVFDVVSGDFSTELAADTANGIYIGLAGDPTGLTKIAQRRFSGSVNLAWFLGSGNDWDLAIDNAADYLTSEFEGGTINLPLDEDVTVNSPHVFVSPIMILGAKRGTRSSSIGTGVVYVADGVTAFQWGIRGDTSTRMIGGGMKHVVARGVGYTRGNVEELYGSVNPTFGYSTITTVLAGAVNAIGDNMTNVLAELQYGFLTEFEGNDVKGFGTAYRNVASTYNVYPQYNEIMDCTVGIYVGTPGIPTTMGIKYNKIERCAIGVHCNSPAQMVHITDNVIEANYGGCDVLIFALAHTIDIERNYFEASPNSIVIKSSGSNAEAHLLKLRKNTGIDLFFRGLIFRNTILEDNWINRIEIAPFAEGRVENITFRNNTDGASRLPFVPDASNFVLNSVAQQYSNEIHFENDNITPRNAPLVEGAYDLAINQTKNVFNVATATQPAATFKVLIPNIFVNAVIKVKILKSTNSGQGYTYGDRFAEYTIGVRRASADVAARTSIIVDTDQALAVGDDPINAMPTPSFSISGASTADQVITYSLAGNSPGASTGNNLVSVEYISSVCGLTISKA